MKEWLVPLIAITGTVLIAVMALDCGTDGNVIVGCLSVIGGIAGAAVGLSKR